MRSDTTPLGRRPGRSADDVPVVIVGAGPAGLATALTLASYGIEHLLVERRTAPMPLPRATAISVRTMELLRAWGLEREVRAGGDDVEWLMLVCDTLSRASRGAATDVGYPTRAQSSIVSPTAPGCIPQDHLESVLLGRLRSLPASRVELGVAVDDVRDRPGGHQVVLRDVAAGTARTITATYVIGADGGRSLVRERAGIPVSATDRLWEAMAVVVHAPLWDVVGEHRYGIYAVEDPAAAGIFLPAGQRDRWVYAAEWEPARARFADLTPDRLTERVRAGAGRAGLAVRLGHVGTFPFVGALADRYRHGRMFLAGDAAHRLTPRGGTGLNTAVADGFDLGWKLAWVLNGWASEALLDTYEAERRPVAEHQLARSLEADGSRRTAADALHVDLGGRIRHVWMDGAQRRRSTLDLVGRGLTLLTGPGGTARPARLAIAYPAAPVTVHELDPVVARTLGITPGGGLLVRPDGVPVGPWGDAEARRGDAFCSGLDAGIAGAAELVEAG